MKKSMNINEIARLSGVSRATVSRYLNNGYVSEEKREKIKAVIEKTGYHPSTQAQTLRTRKTRLIGVIIPKINSDTVSRMVAGISQVLTQHQYRLLLANTNNDEKEELNYLTVFKDNQVDGVILIGTVFTGTHKKLLKEYRIPVVILGQRLPGYSCVYHDDYQAVSELTKRMLKTAKKTGYIGVTQRDEAAGKSRKEGFLAAFLNRQADGLEDVILEADFSLESGYEAAKCLMENHPDLDSLVCATDNIAIGAMMYLKETGKRVPEDVQLAGIGDTPMAQVVTPSLSTVHFYYKTSGIEAAELLMEFMDKKGQVRKEIKMGYELILRDSVRDCH